MEDKVNKVVVINEGASNTILTAQRGRLLDKSKSHNSPIMALDKRRLFGSGRLLGQLG